LPIHSTHKFINLLTKYFQYQQAEAQFIRYTPSQNGAAFNSGAQQRVIRMVEIQRDPMSPPRFK